MKKVMLSVLVIVFASLFVGLIAAQDDSATEEPTGPAFPPPTVPLISCTAEDSPTTVCDVIATSAEDIAGLWTVYFNAEPAFIRYNADGTWWVVDTIENSGAPVEGYPTGTFSFDESGVFTTGDPMLPEEDGCNTATYVLRVIKVGDAPVALNKAMLEDCFPPRRTDWAYTLLWVSEE